MRRLDHAAIYLLIPGTYTPFGLLVLSGVWRWTILPIVWLAGIVPLLVGRHPLHRGRNRVRAPAA
jgi:hemolysin III